MKKTLMALAVGAAFAAPAAYADVTLSGTINMGIEYLNVGSESQRAADARGGVPGTPRRNGTGNLGIATNYSNVNISSMEDLGGGLKLDFNFQIVAPTASVGGVSNRNSHIGLVGDSWGGVWYGSNENIYERYFYTIDPLDGAAGLGGNLQMLGTPGGAVFSTCGQTATPGSCGYTFYRRDEQTIWYDSPNWNGFTFGAAYQTNYAKNQRAGTNPQMFQLGAKYAGTTMPLELWGAYARRKDQFGLEGAVVALGQGANSNTASGSTDQGWHLGGAYTLGDVKVFGGYEDLKWKLNGGLATDITEYKRAAWYIGLKWNLASGYLGAQFIQALKGKAGVGGAGTNTVDETGAYSLGVGYYHNMSKQTQLYGVISYIDNKDLANYGTAGIGNASSFNNLGATYWGAGVGIRHAF